MRYAMVALVVLGCLLWGEAALAKMPIDVYSARRVVRILDDLAVCLTENAESIIADCNDIEAYEWGITDFTQPMIAAGAAGRSWEHFQSKFMFQKHVDCMVEIAIEIDEICDHVLADPPHNWQISAAALETVDQISDEVPDLLDELEEIQEWLDVSWPHRDYQMIRDAALEIEEIEAKLHELIGELAMEIAGP